MDTASGSSQNGMPFYKLFIRCALFTIVFCVISLLTVGIVSAIFYNTENPTAKISLLGYISLYLSVFITSFIMTRINGEKWLFGGIILGVLISLVTLLFSIFTSESSSVKSIVFRILIILVSLISAFLGRKRDSKKNGHKIPHPHR